MSAANDAPISVFFYGSYINRGVLAEVDLAPRRFEPATLPGFALVIRPRANLVRAGGSVVFGVLAEATHAELERLYAHARDVLGEIYRPEAVLVRTHEGRAEPALCYIAPAMDAAPAEAAYVERILGPARELGFPPWYLALIASFRP